MVNLQYTYWAPENVLVPEMLSHLSIEIFRVNLDHHESLLYSEVS